MDAGTISDVLFKSVRLDRQNVQIHYDLTFLAFADIFRGAELRQMVTDDHQSCRGQKLPSFHRINPILTSEGADVFSGRGEPILVLYSTSAELASQRS